MLPQKTNTGWLLVPIVGSFLFIVLYIIAASLYPGGSEIDKASVGYSLTHNYWCNLLNKNGINGENNPGQPFAITAMLIIFLSLSAFWIFFPMQMGLAKYHRLLIQIPGVLGMISSLLLLTELDHDLVVNISSSLGFIAMMGTLIALFRVRWYKLFAFGLFNILLIAVNNYFYYTKGMILYLPIIQILTFVFFLTWFSAVSLACMLTSRSKTIMKDK